MVFLPQGRRGRRSLSNEPLCASNGEEWGRWWTSKRVGGCAGVLKLGKFSPIAKISQVSDRNRPPRFRRSINRSRSDHPRCRFDPGRKYFLIFLPQGRRGRRPLSNEPLCASNGEVWGRWWTSTREGVCWCSETGEILADRENFINRRSKSTLVSPVVLDQKARSKSPPVASVAPRKALFRRGS